SLGNHAHHTTTRSEAVSQRREFVNSSPTDFRTEHSSEAPRLHAISPSEMTPLVTVRPVTLNLFHRHHAQDFLHRCLPGQRAVQAVLPHREHPLLRRDRL